MGLDLAPGAFLVVVTGDSTGHLLRTSSVGRSHANVDHRTVGLEFQILVARLEVRQVVGGPSRSGVGDGLPGIGIRKIRQAEFVPLVVVQLQAWLTAAGRALRSGRLFSQGAFLALVFCQCRLGLRNGVGESPLWLGNR